MEYLYLGDKLTAPHLKGAKCKAIRNHRRKCVVSKMATMLVRFENGKKHVILRRLLRKLPIQQAAKQLTIFD